MKSRQKLLLSVSSGVLLSLAWPPLPFFPLLFIGFVPILWLEDICSESKNSARSFFGYSYLALLIWNVGTTWWVGATYLGTHDISTALAGVFANTANPLLMCIPLLGFHRTKKKIRSCLGLHFLPCLLDHVRVHSSAMGSHLAVANPRQRSCKVSAGDSVV